METQLHKLYYDTNQVTAFSPAETLLKAVRKKFPHTRLQQVKEWLSGQLAYTLHKQARKVFPRNQILVARPNELGQADLMDMHQFSRFNNGATFILTFIDAFSRLGFAEPIKNKSGPVVAVALDKILSNHFVGKLQTDQGKEFLNAHVRKVLEKHNVYHYTSHNKNIKCAMVERFNRSLKSKLFKNFDGSMTKRYVNVLQSFVDNYNNTVHRVTQMKPSEINTNNVDRVFKNVYGVPSVRQFLLRKPKKVNLKIGDTVRMQYDKAAFDRGFNSSWSDHIYTITGVNKNRFPMFTVNDYTGKRVKKRLYERELQLVKPTTYRVEKILKWRQKGDKREALIKWLNFGNEFNTWEDESNIL